MKVGVLNVKIIDFIVCKYFIKKTQKYFLGTPAR